MKYYNNIPFKNAAQKTRVDAFGSNTRVNVVMRKGV
jgi:hypothetical protein